MSEENAYREAANHCLADLIHSEKLDHKEILLLALVHAVLSVSIELSELNDTVRHQ